MTLPHQIKDCNNELISQYLQGDRLAGDKLFDYPQYQRKFKAIVAKYTIITIDTGEPISYSNFEPDITAVIPT